MYKKGYSQIKREEKKYNPIKITISIVVGLATLGLYGSYCINVNPLI